MIEGSMRGYIYVGLCIIGYACAKYKLKYMSNTNKNILNICHFYENMTDIIKGHNSDHPP